MNSEEVSGRQQSRINKSIEMLKHGPELLIEMLVDIFNKRLIESQDIEIEDTFIPPTTMWELQRDQCQQFGGEFVWSHPQETKRTGVSRDRRAEQILRRKVLYSMDTIYTMGKPATTPYF